MFHKTYNILLSFALVLSQKYSDSSQSDSSIIQRFIFYKNIFDQSIFQFQDQNFTQHFVDVDVDVDFVNLDFVNVDFFHFDDFRSIQKDRKFQSYSETPILSSII